MASLITGVRTGNWFAIYAIHLSQHRLFSDDEAPTDAEEEASYVGVRCEAPANQHQQLVLCDATSGCGSLNNRCRRNRLRFRMG